VKRNAFSPSLLINIFKALPHARAYWVALSGGLDSVVLLRSLAEIQPCLSVPIRAIHINHGLQPQAPEWADFCRDLCRELRIPCEIIQVDIEKKSGESLEAQARHARYHAIEHCLGSGEAVMTAHHQDDQAETLLLHLVKGAGVTGLAAMPVWRSFAKGFLFRPLLGFRRKQLRDWLMEGGFSWVEDPSNKSLDFDRNFLRHEILPKLEAHWSGAVPCVARSASHQGAQVELNGALARLDFKSVNKQPEGTLAIDKLLALSSSRRNNLLYWWLRNRGISVIPTQRQLDALHQNVLLANDNAYPELRIDSAIVQRYRNSLYKAVFRNFPSMDGMIWKLNAPLILTQLGLYLEPQALLRAFSEYDDNTVLTIRFRRGGERFKPIGSTYHRSLKQLFQEWAVPRWLRGRVGLVYQNEKLILVLGYARAEQSGLNFYT
jgi:tRNA(Ile)-lysidine synthase